ncbi:AMP-binding protein [Brevibacterium aurantiacum]|uniref:Long-chain acyl-CoA synthetase n=2 Tax=Brevibacterium aurantiacum TaxID=273384 RepID=A0A2H1JMU4_BREAU|nr:AMP-binding protein [Brevibacterium aurantiacum]AZT92865.1 long-chain fatty acid--CoA ligase [Brevibacterium aurantiacum]SMX88753.1 long-chain acyl-CoA synthetase [Brevibacterium aurantiacum]SMX89841.1 long-chain acyl-CoA synthetase [Brevibacterium aurantiacum]
MIPRTIETPPADSAGGRGSQGNAASSITETMPQHLRNLATTDPTGVAMQEKRYGIWQPMTWQLYYQRVREFSSGLAELGVIRGDIVAVLGDNRPEWLIAELAAQTLGASVVGIYPTSIGDELTHILESSAARVVVAEDQEQVDKLLALKTAQEAAGLAFGIDTIVFYDPHGLEQYTDSILLDFTEVEARGARALATNSDWLDSQMSQGDVDDIAVICTTSGTTSKPKLAYLSHANLLSMAANLDSIDPITPNYRYVSILPFAWIGEQMLAVACGLLKGMAISFPEDASTQRADMREIGPDIMFAPPRIWESMLSEVQVRIDEAGKLKRAVFGWGYQISDRIAAEAASGRRAGTGLKMLGKLANLVATRPIREQLGLTRMKRCYTGGAPLGPDVFRFFHSIGVNLKQIYGQTEICGIAVVHRDDDISYTSVGTPIPGTEIRFSADHEILLRSSSVFRGYHRNPEATAEAVDTDGWLHTSDAGYLDEHGHLVVVDRLKDVKFAADSTMFSNAFIENKLKFSPYVEESVVFTDGAAVTAIITLDPSTVGAWAEHAKLPYTTYTDLAAKPEVFDLVAEEIVRANEDLSEAIRVSRFVLLHKQFDPDDDEITRTRKVRRSVIAQRYGPIIDALDSGAEDVTVDSTITYQDGTTLSREIPLRIYDLSTYTMPTDAARRQVWSGRK